jgi:predicted RNA-binding Zn ribbon-like protein
MYDRSGWALTAAGGLVADLFEKPWAGAGTAGTPALALVNTLDWRLRAEPVELLRGYPDLLRWAWTVEVFTLGEARSLRDWAEAHPRSAARALTDAIAIREAMAEVLQAVARGQDVAPAPLGRLDAACREAWGGRALRPAGTGATWEWRAVDPARPALAGALDAARLLTSPDRARVRECGDAECGWLFLDTSRNRSRRWCSMEGCGNRNKARRFYQRHRP